MPPIRTNASGGQTAAAVSSLVSAALYSPSSVCRSPIAS